MDESKDTPCGLGPTETVSITVFVAPLITETLAEILFVTYTYPLDESKATPLGDETAVMVSTTVLVAPLITETLLEFLFVTYTYPLDESKVANSNPKSNSVSVINGTTNTVVTTVSAGVRPYGVAFDSSNGFVYVTNLGSGSVSILSAIIHSVSKYTVTFTESGLQSGTSWYVNLSNSIDSGAITGSSYTFSLANGTYSYAVSNVSGYSVSPYSGSIVVNGTSVSKAVNYTVASPNTELYNIIGATAAVAAIGSVVVVMIRKRK